MQSLKRLREKSALFHRKAPRRARGERILGLAGVKSPHIVGLYGDYGIIPFVKVQSVLPSNWEKPTVSRTLT